METVSRVVDAGYNALWGDTQQQQQHATATGSSARSGLEYVVEAGKKALWGTTPSPPPPETAEQQTTSHGEEPVSGEQGAGTAMDPYDAGNREEEGEAIPYPTDSKSNVPEQRNIETTSQGAASGTLTPAATVTAAAEPKMLKTTVTGLKRDPAEPVSGDANITGTASRVVMDSGPGHSLKHTSEPFQKESDRLVQDLQSKTTEPATAESPQVPSPAPVPDSTSAPAAMLDEPGSKPISEPGREGKSSSSFSATSSDASGIDVQQQKTKKKKRSKLDKMKNKLRIGSESPKAK